MLLLPTFINFLQPLAIGPVLYFFQDISIHIIYLICIISGYLPYGCGRIWQAIAVSFEP
jgi:hypothetical protein